MSHTIKGSFVHVVFFWLKNPDNQEDRTKFFKELTAYTNEVDVIVSKHIGTPADTNRPVIDSSYTYSLVATFNSREDQDLYQAHPAHLRFVENASSLWEKVIVYDAVSATD